MIRPLIVPPNILERIDSLCVSLNSNLVGGEIDQLLNRTVLLGGKRFRPLISYLLADILSLNLVQVDPYAQAIERVHAASLAHDDVVDNARTRRGSPSINILGSNKTAILSGDILLATVIKDLTSLNNNILLTKMSEVIVDLSVGEWIQLKAQERREYSWDLILDIAKNKTGSLISFAAQVPFVLTKSNENVMDLAHDFGLKVGIAFQMLDDTLDFSENSQKDHLLDLENGLMNFVMFKWFEKRPGLWARFVVGEDMVKLWNSEEIHRAVFEVKNIGRELLDQSIEILHQILKLKNIEPQKGKDLFEVLNYLKDRDY